MPRALAIHRERNPFAADLRAGLPGVLREQVPPRRDRRAGRGPPGQAVHGRPRAQEAVDARAGRHAGASARPPASSKVAVIGAGPGGPDRGPAAGAARLQGDGVREARRPRRHAQLGDSRVPPAAGHAVRRDRERQAGRRGDPVQQGAGPRLHAGRTLRPHGLQVGHPGHRRPQGPRRWASPARTRSA